MKASKLMFMGFVAAMGISSCSKESNSGSGIQYKLRASNQGITQPGDINGGALTARPTVAVNWTTGFANVTTIKFEAESSSGEVEYRSTINQKVDIFDPFATLGTIPVPPGTYEEVEFKASLAPTNNEPAFEVQGDYNGTPIIFRVDQAFEFEAEKENVTITGNNDYTSIINLQLGMLMANISDTELANAVLTNGVIIISSTSNAELYNKIVSNLDDIEDCDFEDDDDHDDDD